MTGKYITHIKYINGIKSSFTFIPSVDLPKSINVSTPMNFVYIGSELLLSLDKNNLWNPVCGKVENGETWENALRRETIEEVGSYVGEIYVVGYVHCLNGVGSIFKPETIFPVCYSFSTSIINNWKPLETKAREFFSHNNALKEFKSRGDEEQLFEIYKYVDSVMRKNIKYTFKYTPGKLLEDVVITSAMTFCYDDKKNFCIVKDFGEDFLSLPGGSCGIDEDPAKCSIRELYEEAQIIPKNHALLGTILVTFFNGDKEVFKMQQARYICEIDTINEFVPQKDGFETDARFFINFNELSTKVKQLMNPTGKEILIHLKEELNL